MSARSISSICDRDGTTEPPRPTDKWECLRCEEIFEFPRGQRQPLSCPNPNCQKRGPFKALTGPWVYFIGLEKFVPKLLADDILKEHHFATHRDSWIIYHYHDGYYSPGGEAIIREICREMLGELAKERHVSEVISHIRDITFTAPEKFIAPVEFLCVKNGVLNTRTKELMPHTPDIIFMQKLLIDYNPSAKCPMIMKRMAEWTNTKGIVGLLQFAGFCLYRNYFIRKALILYGEGSNGKTTLVLFLVNWLGQDNVSDVKVQNLEKRFYTVKLFGKLANICDDLPGNEWFGTGSFKQATGGSPLDGEKKFKDSFSFTSYAKMLFTGNRMPIVNDDTMAFWDRIYLIPFQTRFDGSMNRQNILEGMLTDEEKSGFLNLALLGLDTLLKSGSFYLAEDIEKTKAQYIKISDPVMAFAHEKIIESPLSRVLKSDVYAAYVDYCVELGFPVKENNAFSRSFKRIYPRMDETQITTESGKHPTAWVGIDLAPVVVPDEAPITPAEDTRDTNVSVYIELLSAISLYDIKVREKPSEPLKPS
jgi:putative DNA primase/helicase